MKTVEHTAVSQRTYDELTANISEALIQAYVEGRSLVTSAMYGELKDNPTAIGEVSVFALDLVQKGISKSLFGKSFKDYPRHLLPSNPIAADFIVRRIVDADPIRGDTSKADPGYNSITYRPTKITHVYLETQHPVESDEVTPKTPKYTLVGENLRHFTDAQRRRIRGY